MGVGAGTVRLSGVDLAFGNATTRCSVIDSSIEQLDVKDHGIVVINARGE